MKKVIMVLAVATLMSSASFAATTKDAAKNVGNFWQREGERSGLKESTSSWGNFWKNMNPGKFFKEQEASYNARKGTK